MCLDEDWECACVCVRIWGVKDQEEFGNEINVRNEKVKRVRDVCQCQ